MEKLRQILTLSKEYNIKNVLVNYVKLLFIWSPAVSLLFVFGFNGTENIIRNFIISYTISFTCGFICMSGTYLIENIYQWLYRKRGLIPVKHGPLWGVSVSYIFLVPGLFLAFKTAALVSELFNHTPRIPDMSDYRSGLIFGVLVSSLFLLFEIIRESKEAKQAAELKLKQLENEKLKAQVSALSAQMNPHLLFNALNTIASTIATDPESAEEMVVQLSELYRGILKSAKDEVHSLENELTLCKSYLEIEQKRFGPRVSYKIEIENEIPPEKIKLPVLLLQPLVENAVKHGLTPLKQGGHILVDIKKNRTHLIIRVVDNGIGPDHSKKSNGTGTGLANCESRIKLRYGDNSHFSFLRVNDNQTAVTLQFPLAEVLHD